jgi:PIN domain nuclease of toxin-antitoxin system
MILLDTNVWFQWYWRVPLPAILERRLAAETDLAVCAISVWEIATRQRKGRLPACPPLGNWLAHALAGYTVLEISAIIAAEAGADAWLNSDPADRLIVATARNHGVELVHTDHLIRGRTDLRQSFYQR